MVADVFVLEARDVAVHSPGQQNVEVSERDADT